ncbi:tyrosine-protein phosphatase [Nocardia sp. NPDC006630]|uniref:tyrosine-protein phosphatase n=1 Tax=Nocardia sp. NPDC006630 TaxID=3157181 RepID=UPI0033A09B33
MIRPRLLGASLLLASALSIGSMPAAALADTGSAGSGSSGSSSGSSSSSVQPPTPTGSVVLSITDRNLNLSGVQNARDAGGYRTTDGHTVRPGLVYRTAALNGASDTDLANLVARNVKSVHDLRTSAEQSLSGADKVPAGATEYHNDIIGQASPLVGLSTGSGGGALYQAFITAPGANAGFAAVLRDIETNPGAVLYHCTAGKDRTGWTSAVLLTILGVDHDTVVYDFMLSNYYRGAQSGDTLNGVTASELETAFSQANTTYGSFANYVSTGLALTATDIATLKAKLLV